MDLVFNYPRDMPLNNKKPNHEEEEIIAGV